MLQVCEMWLHLVSSVSMAVVHNHFCFFMLHKYTNVCLKATERVHIRVQWLTASSHRLFDSEGRCGPYVGPDVAFLWSDRDGGER